MKKILISISLILLFISQSVPAADRELAEIAENLEVLLQKNRDIVLVSPLVEHQQDSAQLAPEQRIEEIIEVHRLAIDEFLNDHRQQMQRRQSEEEQIMKRYGRAMYITLTTNVLIITLCALLELPPPIMASGLALMVLPAKRVYEFIQILRENQKYLSNLDLRPGELKIGLLQIFDHLKDYRYIQKMKSCQNLFASF